MSALSTFALEPLEDVDRRLAMHLTVMCKECSSLLSHIGTMTQTVSKQVGKEFSFPCVKSNVISC